MPEAPSHAAGEEIAAEHSALLKFLNAAPIGLVQFTLDGEVELINALSAKLLMPLVKDGNIGNLYTVLAGQVPDLPQRVRAFAPGHGMVFEDMALDFSAVATRKSDPHHVTLSVMRLDAQRMMAMIGDVTAQVRTQRALHESEIRRQLAMTAARIGEWEIDLSSGAVLRSEMHDRLFGQDTASTEWTLENFLRQVHPDDLPAVTHGFHSAVTELQDWKAEFRVVWPDASVHWLAAHGHVESANGKAQRMLCILVETSVQRQADAQRLRAQMLELENRQVREASRVKSQFLANMSHELRTPLNAIIGFTELLQRGSVPPDSPKHGQFLQHISTSGRHLLQLINDVLDMAKVESGKFEFQPETVHVPELAAEVMAVLQANIQTKSLTTHVEMDDTLREVFLDPMRLKQVLYNFLSNAIKFTPAGGHLQLRVKAEGEHHLRIEVEDNGVGIAAEDLDQLFIEFRQLDSNYSKEHAGTGLGLALTRRLIETQGGTVGVRSTLGQGTVFHAVLNRIHGWDAAHPAVGVPLADVSPYTLLMIQDRKAYAAALRTSLTEAGFMVDGAASLEQALQQANSRNYEGITLDMLMADQGGLQALSRIRTETSSRLSPVVGVSMPGEAGGTASFAIANLLCKPIHSEEVAAAMACLQTAGQPSMRVLVVDDDPVALDLMQATLGSLGFQVTCLSSGRQALQFIATQRPDALVLDLMMPGMDGFEVLAALREMPDGRTLPVFIWTAMTLNDGEYAQLARSARAILSKGGGEMAAMVEDLRRWQASTRTPQVATPQAATPPSDTAADQRTLLR